MGTCGGRRGAVPGGGGLGSFGPVAVLGLGGDVAAVVRGQSAVGTGRGVDGELDGDT